MEKIIKKENFTEVSIQKEPRTGTNVGKPYQTKESEKTIPFMPAKISKSKTTKK